MAGKESKLDPPTAPQDNRITASAGAIAPLSSAGRIRLDALAELCTSITISIYSNQTTFPG
jgi:hypothetical protein